MQIARLEPKGEAGKGRPEQVLFFKRKKPHLCFVAPYLWPVLSRDPGIQVVGGAEVQQAILARLFAAAGHRVSVITHDYGQEDGVVVDGITVRKCFRPDAGVPVLRFVHPRLTSMWRLMREIGADIYYQRSSAVWTGIVAEFCRRNGKRSIYAGASDRDFVRGKEQIALQRDRWLYRRGLAMVDRIVAQTPAQIETCRANHGREAVLIQSCYVPPATTSNGECVLWVGTIHDYKRPEMLIELARRLPHRRFVMVGGPSVGGERLKPGYFESIREQAGALPNVEFTGFLPLAQVETRFDRARVLVSTSVYEGMPNVFLQAWARGIPTVATVDVGTPVNMVFDGLEEGAARLERLLRDRNYWDNASAAVREYFDSTHSASRVLASYARLFEELCP